MKTPMLLALAVLLASGAAANDYVLVLSRDASPSEARGAREIQRFIQEMTGRELPLAGDEGPLPEHAILVGRSRQTDALVTIDEAALGDEAFILRTVGPHLVVAGSRRRGTLYGCYELLDRLGVRFYTPSVTRVPSAEGLVLPALDETGKPAFEYREPFFTEAWDQDWSARNRLNGSAHRLDESTGGKIAYHPFVHTFEALIPPSLHADHPEYFSLVGDSRFSGYGQRCLSNPDVLRISIERVRAWIADHPEATIYSVSQNDTGNACECDACKALMDRYGGPSGLYVWFVNQVAEAIEKDHPDKLIDTLAYQFTESPPRDVVPRANVRIRLCPIACCEAHPYEVCSDPANVAFVEHLRGWSRITQTLYIWHYNTDFAHYLVPFPDFAQFPASLRLYRSLGVKGVFFEGAYAPGGGGSDAELRSWVMARLLWNPDLDSNRLVGEWMEGVYGPAAKPMRDWFDLVQEQVLDSGRHLHIYDPPAFLPDEILARGDELFDEAERLAAADATARDYVAKSRLWLRYTKLARKPRIGPEFEGFVAALRERGITQLRESEPLENWIQRFRREAGGR